LVCFDLLLFMTHDDATIRFKLELESFRRRTFPDVNSGCHHDSYRAGDVDTPWDSVARCTLTSGATRNGRRALRLGKRSLRSNLKLYLAARRVCPPRRALEPVTDGRLLSESLGRPGPSKVALSLPRRSPRRLLAGVRSGPSQVRFMARPKSRTMRANLKRKKWTANRTKVPK
jgi:hypothetical protein